MNRCPITYLCCGSAEYSEEGMQLPLSVIDGVLNEIKVQIPEWKKRIEMSFLSEEAKQNYLQLVQLRSQRLFHN